MTDQERIKLLREKANWHDQISRELHASADQLEERHASDAMRNMRQRSHGNAQAKLSALALYKIPASRRSIASSTNTMDGSGAI